MSEMWREARSNDAAARGGSRLLVAASALLILGVAAGCRMDATGRHDAHAEVAGVLLIDSNGLVLDPETDLVAGWPGRVEVRFVDERGSEIAGLEQDHRSALSWSPAGSVISDTLPGQPFHYLLRVADPCAAALELRVGYGHIPFADERIFGPYPFTPRDPVRRIGIFDESGVRDHGLDRDPGRLQPTARGPVLRMRRRGDHRGWERRTGSSSTGARPGWAWRRDRGPAGSRGWCGRECPRARRAR
jgi:hypothetical protein